MFLVDTHHYFVQKICTLCVNSQVSYVTKGLKRIFVYFLQMY